MSVLVSVRNVTKIFGDKTVLNDISLDFQAGKIHGLIGRNGSGKSMLFKIICGFIRPTKGEVIISGKRIGIDIDVPESIGVVIETPGFLPNLTAYQNLRMLASLNGRIADNDVKSAIRLLGLDATDNKKVGKYSLGMRQRLAIAQAIMEKPKLLVLDEPMNGLDHQGVRDVREILQACRNDNVTILLASHQVEDIKILCDTTHEIDAGAIL